ncbi:thiamine-phosphate kinase [Methanobacterium alcaliphilum]|uniref:thiamine-phosphate kinase n=1 Tax=Methanobacterium alcaliphilum TaxID=392018 RepID=UPI00200A548E|nr:thiamine-phosphate kinase [Methanobacterium alcaliphilum]MCK9151117.1 thiamine-phosphate kinase [Methanobacterium alcaliphilum]
MFKKLLVSDFGEKKLINRIIEKTNLFQKDYFKTHPQIKESLGDDAALIDLGTSYLAATSDMLMEDTHFPHQMTAGQRGWKTVTVNVSDLAAMGAQPKGIIISMGLPVDMELEFFDDLINGILEACQYYHIPLIGGDTNESPQLVLSGNAMGEVSKKTVLMKSGAEPGDLILVTGALGMAAAGFEILLSDFSDKKIETEIGHETINKVINYALNPRARLKEGISVAEAGILKVATDITDGLASELWELMQAANEPIGMRIYEDKIPIPPEVVTVGQYFNKKPLEMALYYGEDFELLLISKKEALKELEKITEFYVVGEVTSGEVMEIIDKQGKTNILPPGGYQHLGGRNEKGSNSL